MLYAYLKSRSSLLRLVAVFFAGLFLGSVRYLAAIIALVVFLFFHFLTSYVSLYEIAHNKKEME